MTRRIPCVLMRGGTSKGLLFRAEDLPADPATRDEVLLRAMGSPDARQIDGVGGADPLTSKVGVVSVSRRDDADVDYLFAQVAVDRPVIDTNTTCGNLLAAVAPYAVDSGLVRAVDGETTVRVYSVNTNSVITAVVQTPGGQVTYEGDTGIDGVPGTAAPVKIDFRDGVGSRTGRLLPTGRASEIIRSTEVTCIDMATPLVVIAAASLGVSGYETKAELDADTGLLARLESIRQEASHRMGLGDATGRVIPKVCLVAPARYGTGISSRYFVPFACHPAHAVTGAVGLAVATAVASTVAHQLASGAGERRVRIEHPAGAIEVELDLESNPADPGTPLIHRAAVVRTARRLFEGNVLVPSPATALIPRQARSGASAPPVPIASCP